MKKSQKKILIFQLILLLILLINSFVSNILGGYNLVILLIILNIVFYKYFGYEKPDLRYKKIILFEVMGFLIVFFSFYYLSGLLFGFAKTQNYYSYLGFRDFIIPITFTIILKETLRYMLLRKSDNNKLLIFSIILFIFIDITNLIYVMDINDKYNIFLMVALSLMPSISLNIANTYVSMKVGYVPVILYSLVMKLYLYLIPIVPDPNEYIAAIIYFVLPILYGYRIYSFFKKRDDDFVDRDYNKPFTKYIILPIILMSIVIYLTSGYFKYYAVAIASGSMSPEIQKGDLVIIEKLGDNNKKIKIDDVLAYEYDGVLIVHRVVKIIENEKSNYYYTKGDANPEQDKYPVTDDMIIGKVSIKIPYIGLPTVWLNET